MPQLYNQVYWQFAKRTKLFYELQREGENLGYISILEFYVINYDVKIDEYLEYALRQPLKEHTYLFKQHANKAQTNPTKRRPLELFCLIPYYRTEKSEASAYSKLEERF